MHIFFIYNAQNLLVTGFCVIQIRGAIYLRRLKRGIQNQTRRKHSLPFLAVPFEVVEYAASSQEFDAKFEAGED